MAWRVRAQVVPGYWRKEAESKKAIDARGFLHTGDVGFRDSQGWFFVVDRKKDLIIASGYKVWPREVEDRLLEHAAVKVRCSASVCCADSPVRRKRQWLVYQTSTEAKQSKRSSR